MTQPTLTPAQRADQRSRITRTIARILGERVIKAPDIAHAIAEEVADGLIQEHGGSTLYVPVTDRRAGLNNRSQIETMLRASLTPEQIAGTTHAPSAVIATIATTCQVSPRTVYRVLESQRDTPSRGAVGQACPDASR